MSLVKKIKSLFKIEKPIISIPYCGYKLFYSEGTSIVERFKRDGKYEQATLSAILNAIKDTQATNFIDIGANVGLIALAVLENNPSIKVFSFEPGPHQFKLLQKTCNENNLSDRLSLSPLALSNENGTSVFHIHSNDHASGDGFLDTERAGKSQKIEVNTRRLDDWWIEQGKPLIKVIKCDTEGAELFILQGAEQLIKSNQPQIILEIYSATFLKYHMMQMIFTISCSIVDINYIALMDKLLNETNQWNS
ncbi:MAG: FkbM family methyltransferase [Crocinitomicaceae bacterium]|nr:FkbM family methyltransferase [Crocinitomicaceae bacterium]